MTDSLIIRPESIHDLIQREIPKNPCWIEPNILPKYGKLLFGGHAKVGKSFIMLELARALASGTSPFECHYFSVPEPVKVLVIEQELGPYGLQKRVKQVYKNVDDHILRENLWYVSRAPELQFDNLVGRKYIHDLIAEVQPNVLIIDPAGKIHSYEENSNSDISRFWNHIDALLKEFRHLDMSLILSHHFGKPARDPRWEVDPLSPYNFRGASKWYDDPDCLVTVVRGLPMINTPNEAWYIRTRWESRHGETPEDLVFSVNREGDLRVRYEGHDSDMRRPAKVSTSSARPAAEQKSGPLSLHNTSSSGLVTPLKMQLGR